MLAASTLYGIGRFRSQRSAKRYLAGAIEVVAGHLGNTPTVARNCYIHPGLVESYLQGRLLDDLKPRRLARAAHDLRVEEAAVLRFLQRSEQPRKRSA